MNWFFPENRVSLTSRLKVKPRFVLERVFLKTKTNSQSIHRALHQNFLLSLCFQSSFLFIVLFFATVDPEVPNQAWNFQKHLQTFLSETWALKFCWTFSLKLRKMQVPPCLLSEPLHSIPGILNRWTPFVAFLPLHLCTCWRVFCDSPIWRKFRSKWKDRLSFGR